MKIKDVKVGAIIKRGEKLYEVVEADRVSYSSRLYRWKLINLENGFSRGELFKIDAIEETLEEHNSKVTVAYFKLTYIGPDKKYLILK